MGILAYAVLRNENQALATAPGVLLYASAIFIPLLAYFGHLGNDESIFYSAIATVVAALLFLQTLLRQHRQGRLVMSRAQTSPNRDVLTGLLNRKGFENALAHNVKRMKSERAYAIFLYIRVGGTGDLRRDYGEEGFDAAMVQLAAALSSSVTVVDTVARVASDAFAINVLMPRDAKLANLLAQKILTRTMILATHSAPMAQTARISLAWMPMFGIVLDDLERRSLRALRKMQEGKRITWVGGDQAQAEMSLLTEGMSGPTTRPHHGLDADDLPSLPGMIDRIEEEMLGPDPLTLQIEADRLLRELRQKDKGLAA
jgi:GGDEF domain-containing protein